jgi:hypothetical protein
MERHMRFVIVRLLSTWVWAIVVLVWPVWQGSDDHHRLIHEARFARDGFALPYAVPPKDAPSSAVDGDFARMHTNHPDVAAAYFPGATLALLPVVWLGDVAGSAAIALMVFFLAADALFAAWLLRRDRRAPDGALSAWCLSPLLLVDGAAGRHLDFFGALLLCAAVVHRGRWRPLLLAAAIHMKPIAALALVVMPASVVVTTMLVAVFGMLPLWLLGGPWLPTGATTYVEHWRAQPLLYGVFEALWSPWFAQRADDGVFMHVQVLDGRLLLEQAGQRIAGDAALLLTPTHKILIDARACAKAMSAVMLAVVCVAARRFFQRAAIDAPTATSWLTVAFLTLTPTLHPWYFLWVLPGALFSPLRRDRMFFLSFMNGGVLLVLGRRYDVQEPWIQLILIAVILCFFRFLMRRQNRQPQATDANRTPADVPLQQT